MNSLDTKDKINKCVNKASELGQYFTERHITNYIVNKLLDLSETINIISIPSETFTNTINNTMNTKENDLIETILDPFSGTVGFSTIS